MAQFSSLVQFRAIGMSSWAVPLRSLRQYRDYRRVFLTHGDVAAYRAVRDHPDRFDGPVPIRLKGLENGTVWCRPGTMDPITLWDAMFEGYHLPTFSLSDPRVILDLGANAGYTAVSFAMRYPDARVIAVEMDDDNAALCARNIARFGSRCEVIRAAIWSTVGTISYNGKNVHDYSVSAAASGSSKIAPAITIEALLDRFGLSIVDYLKMDIEGAEAAVLTPPIGWASRVRAMSIEVHPPATAGGCRDALIAAGFDCRSHPHHPSSIEARRSA